MRLPKTLRIGSVRYNVKVIKDLFDDYQNKLFASTSFAKRIIEVEKDLDNHVQLLYILHESLHGIFRSQEITVSNEMEEQVVTRLTHGLAAFIKDNPEYIKELLKGR